MMAPGFALEILIEIGMNMSTVIWIENWQEDDKHWPSWAKSVEHGDARESNEKAAKFIAMSPVDA